MEAIQTQASEVLLTLALGVLSLLGAYGMFFINKAVAKLKAQTQQLESEAQRKLLDQALSDVETLASITIGATEQTLGKTLREAVKNGTADREELLGLADDAFNEIKAAIQPEAQRIISVNLGNFDTYLRNTIEDHVRQVKQEDPGIITLGESIAG